MAVVVVLKKDDKFFIADEVYERNLTVDSGDQSERDLVFRLERLEEKYGVGKVYADPSEPESIKELQDNGFKVEGGKTDVLSGISKVASKQNFIRVHEGCQNVINEFRSYQYKDNDKEKPLKENDHLMDALRYAFFTRGTESATRVETIENPFA